MKFLPPLAIAVLVAGCSASGSRLPLNEPVPASVTTRADNQFHSIPVIIRSFKEDDTGKKVEVAGATCSGRNALFSFKNVTTPAHIDVPTYLQAERFESRGKPPKMLVECQYDGKTVKLVAEPSSAVENVTVQGVGTYNPSTGYSQPTTTSLVSRLSPTLPWRYPQVKIDF